MKISLYLLFLSVLFYPLNSFSKETKNDLFELIYSKYKVKVNYVNSSNYFPKAWKKKDINPKMVPISNLELKRFPILIDKELSKYSLNTLNTNLKSINLAKSISFYNISFGATNFTDSIYITSNGIKNHYTDSYLIHILHHEFSSILLRNYKFPIDEWNSWLPRDFSYGTGGVNALKDGNDSLYAQEHLYKIGLLSEYSKASQEEDFNVYSGMIFSEPKKFLELKQKYPYIREKFNIWLKFYQTIDPKITEKNLFHF